MIDITSIINTVKIDYTLLTIRDLVRRSATDSKAAEELQCRQQRNAKAKAEREALWANPVYQCCNYHKNRAVVYGGSKPELLTAEERDWYKNVYIAETKARYEENAAAWEARRKEEAEAKAAEELAEKQRYDFAFSMQPRHPGAARERWVERVSA